MTVGSAVAAHLLRPVTPDRLSDEHGRLPRVTCTGQHLLSSPDRDRGEVAECTPADGPGTGGTDKEI